MCAANPRPAPMTRVVRASPLFDYRPPIGRRNRQKGFMRGQIVMCPYGHKVRGLELVRVDHFLQCHHRAAAGQGECGHLIYVRVYPHAGGGRDVFAADVTFAEMREIEALNLDGPGVLEYFGVEQFHRPHPPNTRG